MQSIDSKTKTKPKADPTLISSFTAEALESLEQEKKTGKEQKLKEKHEDRKREYVYSKFDYILKPLFGFDFFSQDAFEIFLAAKKLAYANFFSHVETEMLLFGFFSSNSRIRTLFADNNVILQTLETSLPAYYIARKEKKVETKTNVKQKGIVLFLKQAKKALKAKRTELIEFFDETRKKIISQLGKRHYRMLIQRMHDRFPNLGLPFLFPWLYIPVDVTIACKALYSVAFKNAQKRFYMPAVNADILFLTFIEEKRTCINHFIKKIIWDAEKWALLHFQTLKRIYFQKLAMKKITSSNLYFAYLMKMQLGEKEYENQMIRGEFAEYLPEVRNILLTSARSFLLVKKVRSAILKGKKKFINNRRM